MKEPEITLALADDHPALRQAFSTALSGIPSMRVLFDVRNGKELLERLKQQQPEVILLDFKMPEMGGAEALKCIHDQYPAIRVLIFSAFLDEVYVARCLQYGINGYLTKDMEFTEILRAIELAYQNKVYYSNLMEDVYFKNYIRHFNKMDRIALPDFSEEEIKILELLRLEKTTEEISAILFMSKRSVELKREKMKEKASVKTVAGLLLYSVKRGLLSN